MTKRAVIYGCLPVPAFLSAVLAGILALSENRAWPVALFVSAALLSVILLVSRPRRPAARVLAALVATAALALGGLSASYAVLGLPLNADDLRRTCTERVSHPRSAPLGTEHVTRTFLDTGTGFSHWSAYDQRPVDRDGDLTAVQRVACLRRTGIGQSLNSCPYGQAGIAMFSLTLYQGTWEMDVREARTGRTLAVLPVAGDTDPTCPSVTFVRDHENPTADYTEPTAADVLAALN